MKNENNDFCLLNIEISLFIFEKKKLINLCQFELILVNWKNIAKF